MCVYMSRGWHSNISCTPIFVLSQSKSQKQVKGQLYSIYQDQYFCGQPHRRNSTKNLLEFWTKVLRDFQQISTVKINLSKFSLGQRLKYSIHWSVIPLSVHVHVRCFVHLHFCVIILQILYRSIYMSSPAGQLKVITPHCPLLHFSCAHY